MNFHNKEENYDDNIKFYVLCFLLGENAVYEILKIVSGERRHFINNIFQSPSSKSSFPISYLMGLIEFLTNGYTCC